MDRHNCPSAYYSNCHNASFKCFQCVCGQGKETDNFFYKPKVKGIGHPYLTQLARAAKEYELAKKKDSTFKARSHYVKNGYQKENQLLKQTVRSGAVFNDGDLHSKDGLFRIDSKLRHNQKSFTLKPNEYAEGVKAKINTWIVTNRTDGTDQSVVMITYELFQDILTLLQIHE